MQLRELGYDLQIRKNISGTRSRTPDLLITSLCNNCYKSMAYEYYLHKTHSKHPCFISVLEEFIHKLLKGVGPLLPFIFASDSAGFSSK